MITSSLEWAQRKNVLAEQIRTLPYNSDLRKMLANIEPMVRDLSRAEVFYRRTRRSGKSIPELDRVNDAINELEKWIIMGKLWA